jgi:hypothetical protein
VKFINICDIVESLQENSDGPEIRLKAENFSLDLLLGDGRCEIGFIVDLRIQFLSIFTA